ncbi:AraC-type DNA-binding protein [Tenacibaculum sp. MAR_2010_89]|uniref:helix-turn-helix domain-containing protein n=1 Tax=Tenacibaculum sp. MAR_2010_89 TaxID=1250198 RepID=UPI000899DBE6|nr:helix-turn-helix domain-containing protein [Tenacibaculum sp. MAR_2010_89]SEE58361.1 AraC-type DNA-binding protein [Tenacibaculum sp. MAR_2010_89]
MQPQFSLFDLLILIGIIQGVITSILLLSTKKNKNSNKFLAFALLSFCFLSTKPLLHTLNLWNTSFFRFFPNGIELALSPLIYFYIKSLISPEFRFKNKNWIHFIPFTLAQTYAFVVYFYALLSPDFYEKDLIALNFKFNYIKQLEEYLLLAFLPFYLFYGYKELTDYKKWLCNTTSDNTYPNFKWLQNIYSLSILVSVFLLTNHTLDIFFNLKNKTIIHYNLLTLFIAFIIYYLGLKGYLQPNYTFSRHEITSQNKSVIPLSNIKLEETIDHLQKAMLKDKIYLNPKLNIYELSKLLGISQKSISLAINQHYKMNFRDFINDYRINEVKSKLNDSNYKKMSILGIALECGFNSEASFYRIFKKNTGISPKEFIELKNDTKL